MNGGIMSAMNNLLPKNLDELSSDALRALVQQQAAALAHHEQVVVQQKQALAHKDEAIKTLELINSKLKHELGVIRRYRFGQKSEQYSGAQELALCRLAACRPKSGRRHDTHPVRQAQRP